MKLMPFTVFNIDKPEDSCEIPQGTCLPPEPDRDKAEALLIRILQGHLASEAAA